MRFVLVAGTTETASIPGISAAGTTPSMMAHTPLADAEIVTYGTTVFAPVIPVSPSGCPTPAIVSRAIRELVGFEILVLDAGIESGDRLPAYRIAKTGGEDIREEVAVHGIQDIIERAYELGRSLPDSRLIIGETIPGGTTTALGVLRAIGKPYPVSSSLPENPQQLKQEIVETGLEASQITPGSLADDPIKAIATMGDPVLAGTVGTTLGALDQGTSVTLAGGTQQVAAAAMIRQLGRTEPLELATTSFIVEDVPEIESAAQTLNLELTVTDPGFSESTHTAFQGYCNGEAKEGVGMGGALSLANETGLGMERIRNRIIDCYDRMVVADGS